MALVLQVPLVYSVTKSLEGNVHFFLQGSQGSGKSYLLQEALSSCQQQLAGFCVQRLFKNGDLVGFRVQNVKEGLPPLDMEENGKEEGVFLYHRRRNLSVLEDMIARVEHDSRQPQCRLVLLDEIGGAELSSTVFMEHLHRILGGEKPCLGVFKSAQNLAHMAKMQNLDETYLELHKALEGKLRKQGQLYTLTGENRQACAAHLSSYLSDIL